MAQQVDSNVIENVLQFVCDNGVVHMTEAMRLKLNAAMRLERFHRGSMLIPIGGL